MFENLYTAPYPYPYAAQQQTVPAQQQQKVPIVSSEAEVRSDSLAPDSSKLYMDASGQILWIAVTDSLGIKTVMSRSITQNPEPTAPDYSGLEQRLARLEERFNGYSENAERAEQRTDNRNQSNQGFREQNKRHEQS